MSLRNLLHNTASMPFRLILALALSLALHGVLFLPDLFKRLAAAPPRPALQAVLRLPPVAPLPPAEPLLKNTLDTDAAPEITRPLPPEKPLPASAAPAKRQLQAAQRKLSAHLFYPPEAVARGLEGETRLIIKLAADGRVDEVSIAASSGYAILDNAAIKAAYAMGSVASSGGRELVLPVIFRLQ